MTREQFIELISTKSVDELIEMMPPKIPYSHKMYRGPGGESNLRLSLSGSWKGKKDNIAYTCSYGGPAGQLAFDMHTVCGVNKSKILSKMLLWLYDNNLLPEYSKDD